VTQTCQTPTNETYCWNRLPESMVVVLTGVSELTLQSLFESEETASAALCVFAGAGRRAVAEEIVQEVFLQLHKHWDDVDCPKAWLYSQCSKSSL
jgi:DNA-directed RNA polymerase specialized sigma24 family protein